MLADWSAALEGLPLAKALRDSVWAYPLVNTAHILGVALLVGSILSLDLRLLGFWRSLPLSPLWRVLGSMAALGLLLAIGFGGLLFVTRATEYLASPFFLAKMAAVGAGLVNAAALRFWMPRRLRAGGLDSRALPIRVRIGAAISLVAWLSALTLGRLVGYF